jgi:DNA-binding transcriptional LysR family regulator
MDTLGAMALFVRAAETRSFSETARQLRITPSAVSRSIARLERELDARLLHRSTHAVTLTEAGQAFLERATRVVAEFEEAKDALEHGHRGPRGTLRVDAPLGLGRLVVAPMLPSFLTRYPDLRVELSLRDRIVDPIAEGIDVLVRIGEPKEASLTMRKVGVARFVVCGAPAYFKRRGVPKSVADLARHDCLAFLRAGRPRPWILREPDGGDGAPPIEMIPRGRFATDNADALRDLAVAGLGLICLLDFMVTREIAARQLRTVLDERTIEQRTLFALQPLHRQASAKARVFIDHLVDRLARR